MAHPLHFRPPEARAPNLPVLRSGEDESVVVDVIHKGLDLAASSRAKRRSVMVGTGR